MNREEQKVPVEGEETEEKVGTFTEEKKEE